MYDIYDTSVIRGRIWSQDIRAPTMLWLWKTHTILNSALGMNGEENIIYLKISGRYVKLRQIIIVELNRRKSLLK